MDANNLDGLVEKVVGAAYEVQNFLGPGFLEKVYERALVRELALRGLTAKQQVPFSVFYKGYEVGSYVADLIIDDRLVVELKCVDALSNDHMAQCINYLKVSGLKIAILINFQRPRVEWKRIVYQL